jgi:hypothetical protein
MKLLNTYEEAEKAEMLVTKEKRLASERDDTEVIYNLFGQPSWKNFHKIKILNLPLLQQILKQRKAGQTYDKSKHQT